MSRDEPPGKVVFGSAPIRAADSDAIGEAAEKLRAGDLVAVPTETVYGLAALAGSEGAVAKLYAAKGRPPSNPLIVHVFDAAMAQEIAALSDRGRMLAELWPGPLTLVASLRDGAGVASNALAGGTTVAVRVPKAATIRSLIEKTGPLVA
ncbi:MAG: L-threonylcarbamoyladenylate synthase, partial [Pseudomonadota bacterium]